MPASNQSNRRRQFRRSSRAVVRMGLSVPTTLSAALTARLFASRNTISMALSGIRAHTRALPR
eukprot:841558-Rhodomonas_salina.2